MNRQEYMEEFIKEHTPYDTWQEFVRKRQLYVSGAKTKGS